ncbi:protein ACCELERATED CELL DEATH 6-like [Rhododendron vialii]|uniref:protein ACCELERATED CELL DEATH 6-like n=1 Tax=Rhododendron vialii TaxID=182163 RepID=UPI00265F5907|nr:protein ACCELERATED CELL DEATH 6-like [Rhododendron vialii]
MTTMQEREERNEESEEGIIERMPSKRETWKDRTEEWLCDAAIRGDVVSLKEIMTIDEYILDKVLVGSFKGKNPLHMATSTGQKEFVQELLKYEKDLANVVDTELGTALHVASSKGYSDIVKLLVKVNPEMCVACDREGNNPLHIATMKGNDEVLKVLLRTNPRAARLMVDRGDNILHLCVNYNQLESLKLLLDEVGDKEFVNCTDIKGNNILHLAVFGKRHEIIKHLLQEWPLKKPKDGDEHGQLIDVNARNGSGWTALDIHSQVAESEDKSSDEYIKNVLREYGVKRSDKLFFPFDPYWQKKKKDTLMIVSSLMATMSFQVGINPPGGVWVDSSPEHKAGKAIVAYTIPKAYPYLMYFNTLGFLLSLTTILELIVVLPTRKRAFGFIRAGISWLTIMIMAFAYAFSVIVVSPTEMYKPVNLVISVTVTVWAAGVTFLRVLPYHVNLKLLRLIGYVLLLPVLLPVGIAACFVGIYEVCCETEPIGSTVQSTGDTASTPNPTAVSQNDSTSVSIPD